METQKNSTSMPSFSLLPEGCIARIISLTSPEDAARAALVSSMFKSASESDTVWEPFLSPNYGEIVSASTSPVTFSTKKELYLSLCDSPLLLDGGKLSFRLSKPTGKKCYTLSSRVLEIAWVDCPEHWQWKSLSDSKFAEVPELIKESWIDIHGKLEVQKLSPSTNYAAYLVYKVSDSDYNFDLDCPSLAWVKVVKANGTEIEGEAGEPRTVYIVPPIRRLRDRRWTRVDVQGKLPVSRADGWLEIELGEFFVGERENFVVHAHLGESWKKDIIVEGIELRPNEAV